MITVLSFAGHDLDSASYRAILSGEPYGRRGDHVLVRPPGGWPRHVRVEDRERTIELVVILQPGVTAQDAQEELASWFAVGTEGELVVDFDGDERALTCVSLIPRPWRPYTGTFSVTLVAAEPRWHAASADVVTQAIGTSGQTFAIVNNGTASEDAAVVSVTPTSQKAAANGWLYALEVVVAWRATRASSGAYPLEITEGWNHAGEVSAGRSKAGGEDVRVLVDGVEVPRWWGSNAATDPDSATSKIWIAPTFSPRRTFALLSTVLAGSPATGGDLEVEKGGTLGWPQAGAFVLDDEVITYTGRTESNASGRAAFTGITRGARTSTASGHSAGAVGYWLEHRIQIVYGNTGATAPDARADLEPMLDRSDANLTNERWIWRDFRDSRYPGRAAQWQRVYRGLDGRADRILAADGAPLAVLTHEYQSGGAQAGKPAFDTWRMPVPAGGVVSGTLLELTRVVADTLALVLTGNDDDGNEVALATAAGPLTSATLTIAAPTSSVFDLMVRTRSQVVAKTPGTGLGGAGTSIGVGSPSATAGLQQFTVEGDGVLSAVMLYMDVEDVTTRNVTVEIWSDDGSGAPLTLLDSCGGVFSVAITPAWYTRSLSTPLQVKAGTKLWIRAWSSSTETKWYQAPVLYGSNLGGDGSATTTHTFKALSTTLDFDEFAEADDGDTATVDVVDLRLLAAGAPYVNRLARVDRYWFRGAELENVTTGQVITLRSALLALNETLEFDVAAAAGENVDTGEPLSAAALEFSDPAGRFELAPGSNTIKLTEAGLAGVTVGVTYRSRWQ